MGGHPANAERYSILRSFIVAFHINNDEFLSIYLCSREKSSLLEGSIRSPLRTTACPPMRSKKKVSDGMKLVEVVGWSCRRCHPESVATPERRPRHLNKQIKVISITHHRHFCAQNLFKIMIEVYRALLKCAIGLQNLYAVR